MFYKVVDVKLVLLQLLLEFFGLLAIVNFVNLIKIIDQIGNRDVWIDRLTIHFSHPTAGEVGFNFGQQRIILECAYQKGTSPSA